METDTLTCSLGDLQYASFCGVPFWVKSDEVTVGVRWAHHEFAKGDIPANERMGRRQRKYSVTGYLVGDGSRDQKDVLEAICETPGQGLLILPAEDPGNVVCDTCVITRDKDDQDIFHCKMEFYEDPLFGGLTIFGGGVIEGIIGGMLSAAVSPISAYFLGGFDVIDVQPYVYDNCIARVQTFAQTMLTKIETAGITDETPVTKAITDLVLLFKNAPSLVRPTQGDTSVSAVGTLDNTTSLDVIVSRIFMNIMNVQDASTLFDTMQTLAGFSSLETTGSDGVTAGYPGPQTVTIYTGGLNGTPATMSTVVVQPENVAPSEIADAANAAAFNGMVRSFALIGLAKAIAASEFTDRRVAIQVRANLVELMQQQMERIDNYDVAIALTNARDYCVKALSQQITSIVPLVHVSSTVTLPSIYWAGRLYNDATRALELSDRNNVRTPAYMPQEFDALHS